MRQVTGNSPCVRGVQAGSIAPRHRHPCPVQPSVQPSVHPFVVLKFGGSSVAGRPQWEALAAVLRNRVAEGVKPVIVHSAIRGVTDRLQAVADATAPDPAVTLGEVSRMHRQLASELGLDDTSDLERELQRLEGAVRTPRPHDDLDPAHLAGILACGERLASALGVPWLRSQGFDVVRVDATELLQSTPRSPGGTTALDRARDYLSALCDSDPDPAIQSRIAQAGEVVLTQGFTARHPDGSTVVLGRGGSDTAAAYLAGKLDALRLEVWSDVPGMFTADPRHIPSRV